MLVEEVAAQTLFARTEPRKHVKRKHTAYRLAAASAMLGFLFGCPAPAWPGQAPDPLRVVQGAVVDPQGTPIPGVTVFLESQDKGQSSSTVSDKEGKFHFSNVGAGKYVLRARHSGDPDELAGPFVLDGKEGRPFTLRLGPAPASAKATDTKTAADLDYSDEPHFTISGVTDPSSLGGHGSNITQPTKDALASATASLRATAAVSAGSEHLRLGDAKEAEGKALEALHEYELAVQSDPSETNYLAWGAELLLHRAFEPASEIFGKGVHLHPGSVPLLLGLGAAAYAQDQYAQASEAFLQAIDLNPSDPRSYEFLGRILQTTRDEPFEWTEKFRRYAELQPQSAQSHYLYALALEKAHRGAPDFAERGRQLHKVLELNPSGGDAYLRLGILYSEEKDFPRAVQALQAAISRTALPDEAHFRLAQVYRQMGKPEAASHETQLYKEVSARKKEQAQKEQDAIGQFVYTLRQDKAPEAAPTSPSPRR